jgi:hypothetical protein
MIRIELKGFDKILDKFDSLTKDNQSKIQSALNDFADKTALDAKNLVSSKEITDEGRLLNSIYPLYGNSSAGVIVNNKYAAYMEFGTRKFASSYISSLPTEWKDYAMKFHGKSQWGGSFKDFIESIMGWMKRKGIQGGTYSVKTRRRKGNKIKKEAEDKSVAYAIARKIMKDGIRARPFLYPAVNSNLPKLRQDLLNILK